MNVWKFIVALSAITFFGMEMLFILTGEIDLAAAIWVYFVMYVVLPLGFIFVSIFLLEWASEQKRGEGK